MVFIDWSDSTNAGILNVLFALVFLGLGIFLGKVVSYSLKKISREVEADKKIRSSFLRLIISVIEWSIYLAFASFAINQLDLEGLSPIFSKMMLVVPAIVVSLFILAIGFAVAIYLREIVEDSEITGWKFLSLYIFYFINLIFGLYALRIALIVLDSTIINILSILLVGIIGISISYMLVKKELRESGHK